MYLEAKNMSIEDLREIGSNGAMAVGCILESGIQSIHIPTNDPHHACVMYASIQITCLCISIASAKWSEKKKKKKKKPVMVSTEKSP